MKFPKQMTDREWRSFSKELELSGCSYKHTMSISRMPVLIIFGPSGSTKAFYARKPGMWVQTGSVALGFTDG